jgi:hypothetical protein
VLIAVADAQISNKKDNGAGIARLGYGLQETEFNYKIMHDGEEKVREDLSPFRESF